MNKIAEKVKVRFTVNGTPATVTVPSHYTLLRVLREELGLTGTKEGCGKGECGACTVILDGKPVNSCLVMITSVSDSEVETVEGLAKNGKLHPLQRAFIETGAVQCGFCTPGMLMTAKALLDSNPDPDKKAVRHAISGNLCRCTGYAKIEEAVIKAAGEVR